jgi:hypothetical protein
VHSAEIDPQLIIDENLVGKKMSGSVHEGLSTRGIPYPHVVIAAEREALVAAVGESGVQLHCKVEVLF